MDKMSFSMQPKHIQQGYSIRNSLSLKEGTKKIFHFPSERKIARILKTVNENVKCEDYDDLLNFLRNGSCLSEKNARSLVQAAIDNMELLPTKVSKFVEAILKIKWVNYEADLVLLFQKFLVHLSSAHNYYTKCILKSLITYFVTPDESKLPDEIVAMEDDFQKYEDIHFVINQLLTVTPMCRDLLMQCITDFYPYMKKPAVCQANYVHNLLLILVYAPDLRPPILQLIISKLIILDVHAPADAIEHEEKAREHIFEMDEEYEDNVMKHNVARSLDDCLVKVFSYLTVASHDVERQTFHDEKIKRLYQELLEVFDNVILPTYNIRHVQFVMFLVCSFHPSVTEAFISYLWTKVCTPTIPQIHRHSAVTYIASLIARGSFISIDTLKETLQGMSNWIHAYILAQDGLECVNSDVRVHNVFYSICQALFYVIAFRHTELVNTMENIQFLESLMLLKIVTCRLNPLRVCQPAIVQHFASVTRTYQIVYCYTVIEHNSRNCLPTLYRSEQGRFEVWNHNLDAFFPFDPYLLKRSAAAYIKPIYLNYKTKIEDPSSKKNEDEVCETDDFLFYGSSPGFKHKT